MVETVAGKVRQGQERADAMLERASTQGQGESYPRRLLRFSSPCVLPRFRPPVILACSIQPTHPCHRPSTRTHPPGTACPVDLGRAQSSVVCHRHRHVAGCRRPVGPVGGC